MIELLLWCYFCLFLRVKILKIWLKIKKKFCEVFFSIIKYILIIWLIFSVIWIIVVLIILKFFEIVIIFSIFFVVVIWSFVFDLILIFSWHSVLFFFDYVSSDISACIEFLKKIFNCDSVDEFMRISSHFDFNVAINDI